jgi:hypothetical protein
MERLPFVFGEIKLLLHLRKLVQEVLVALLKVKLVFFVKLLELILGGKFCDELLHPDLFTI